MNPGGFVLSKSGPASGPDFSNLTGAPIVGDIETGQLYWATPDANPFPINFVNVNSFRGTSDDSRFQRAADYVRSNAAWIENGQAGSIYIPPGNYTLTKSINATANNSVGHGIRVFGSSVLNTVINTRLTEAYPVFDFCGNGLTRVEGFSLRQQAGCLATCGLLYGYVGADTIGFEGTIRDALILMTTCPGIVNAGTDLMVLDTVQSTGTYGALLGDGNPLGLTSKYVTILAPPGDVTIQTIRNCNFNGGIPLWLTGANDYEIESVYCAPTFAASPLAIKAAMLIDSSYSTIGSIRIKCRGLRTENQSPAGGQNVINAIALVKNGAVQNTSIRELDINGVLEVTNASGAQAGARLLYSDANSYINDLRIDVATSFPSTYPVLDLNGNVTSLTVGKVDINVSQATLIGTIANKTAGEVCLVGNFPATAIAALSTQGVGQITSGTGNTPTQRAISDYAILQNASALVAGEMGSVTIPATFNQTYSGGSGYQTVVSFAVPAGLYGTSGRAARDLRLFLTGGFTAVCNVRVVYTQGATSATSDVFVGANAKMNMEIHALYFGDIATAYLDGSVSINQSGVLPFAWYGHVATIDRTLPYTIAVQVDSVSSNPTAILGFCPGWWQ